MQALDLTMLPQTEIAKLAQAADRLFEALESLGRRHLLEVLMGPTADFRANSHYPEDDAWDEHSGAQYYYHAHWQEERAAGEHGHFHCFLASRHLAREAKAMRRPQASGAKLSHLVGLSISPEGLPARLFTINHWVSDDFVYPAPAMVQALRHFTLGHASGPSAVNMWLESVIALFRPEIGMLLNERDAAWARRDSGDPFTAQALEVPSACLIDIDARIAAIDAAMT